MSESKTSQKRLEAANRQRRALELRAAGQTFDVIASELGYRSASGAFRAVSAGLRKTLQEPAGTLRKLELERLTKLEAELWTKLARNVSVADKLLRVWERRARLLGLDAPNRVEIGRLLESSDWIMVRDRIKTALEPFPEALESVLEALRGIDNE